MGKLPWFKFYPGDWLIDPALSRCTVGARGVLMDTLCYMWDSEMRGALVSKGRPWTKDELALAVRGEYKHVMSCINQLLDNGVLEMTRDRPVTFRYEKQYDHFVIIPSHTIYSKRLMRDEAANAANRSRQARYRHKHNADVTLEVTPPVTPMSQGEVRSQIHKPRNLTFSQDTEKEPQHATPTKTKWVDRDEERRKRTDDAIARFLEKPTDKVAKGSRRDIHKK